MLMPTITRYMTLRPVTIDRGSTLASAERLMRVHQVRHLPVLHRRRLVGLIVAHDLHMLELIGRLDLETVLVEAVMVQDPLTVSETAPVDEVVELMALRRLDVVVVMDLVGIRGIFTAVDACQALASVLRRAVA